jgi:hypothetical protein
MPAILAHPVTIQPSADKSSRILFDSARIPSRPLFAVPLLPALVHEDGAVCPVCDSACCTDEPVIAEFTGWDQVDYRTLGPVARKEWDVCFGAGEYVAARGKHSQPPAHFDSFQRAAFFRGFAAYEDMHADDECYLEPNDYMDARMVMPGGVAND